ncbi:MAG TPA: NAD(P)H-binding protein [Pseudonocardiaceae bacterium]|nr:NAD(P)H-binding protein [Pseudonocardiaceae bacterium]
MTERPLVILGGTGTVGRRVTAALRAQGRLVRTASRRGDIRFDWADRTTWEPALHGARALFLMAPDGQPIEPELVTEAVRAGVERIVMLSSAAIEVMGDQRLITSEGTVRGSGVDWTIVRASWFNQNFDEGFLRSSVLDGVVTLPLGDSRHGFVDAADIAAVAATCLIEPGHAGRTYVVTGPAALTFAEAVQIVSHASGRPVVYRGEPEDYLTTAAAAGFSPDQARAQLAAFEALRRHPEESAATGTVHALTGRDPIPFPTYAHRAAAAGAWQD